MQIKLNFIPQQARRQKAGLIGEDFGGVPAEIIFGCGAAIVGALILVHVLLAGAALWKLGAHTILQVRWSTMGADKKVFDGISNELKAIQTKMNMLRPITSAQELRWAGLLNDLSDSVPKGVWLREIIFEKGVLTIYGSAFSKMKNEMAEAGNFVAVLKEKSSIKDNFTGMDVDSIQRRDNVGVSVADFVLKATYK